MRVVHLAREGLERVGEDAQVRRQRMPHDARIGQRVDERAEIAQRERVDQRDAVVEQELHDHEVRRIRLLGVELGVERDARRLRDALARLRERFGRVDERDRLAGTRGGVHGFTVGSGLCAGVTCARGRRCGKRM